MLKTFGVALLAVAMSVGLAQAKVHRYKPMQPPPPCAEGRQAAATCACGTATSGQPVVCQKGQWCHSMMHACTQ